MAFQFLFLLCLLSTVALACKNDEECSYLGICDVASSKCICNKGWFGDNCAFINVTSTIDYNIDGYHDATNMNTWDGSPIQDSKTGLWHLYITILTEDCSVGTWLSNSVILHIVANASIGPYTYSDIALSPYNETNGVSKQWDGISVYNPIIIRDIDPNKELYYLFYTGTSAPNAIHINCSISKGGMNTTLQYNQQIGYASSHSLYGPWVRSPSNPILSARKNNHSLWDSGYVCNPYPAYLSNGSMIMIYKAKSAQSNNVKGSGMETGMAMLSDSANGSWNGPYIRYDTYFSDMGNCEDGFFWEQQQNGPNKASTYHMEYHCKCNGSHAYSLDLMDWTYNQEQPWCGVTLTNGTKIELTRRERPAIVFEDEFKQNASFIFNAVQPKEGPAFNFVQKL